MFPEEIYEELASAAGMRASWEHRVLLLYDKRMHVLHSAAVQGALLHM
jgi:hypothetical protein